MRYTSLTLLIYTAIYRIKMRMASMPIMSITTELSPSIPYQALPSRVPKVKNPNRSVAPVRIK